MTVVRKKSRQSSVEDLKVAINKLIYLLEGQGEDDAVKDLRIAARDLEQYQPGSGEFHSALGLITEAFEGEHELNAYTFKRDKQSDRWSEADELFLASTSVISLVRRLEKK